MNHGSIFSGIGGFDLAAKWMGWNNLFVCEKDEFCQKVLSYHFPKSYLHEDVKTFQPDKYFGQIDILTGGFPCQPYSTAGKRLGKNDERHLWPEMLGIIKGIQPTWVVGENVLGISSWNNGLVFEEVCADLEACGYSVQPFVLPAASVGSCPHKRERVWFIAYSDINRISRRSNKLDGKEKKEFDKKQDGLQKFDQSVDIRSISSNPKHDGLEYRHNKRDIRQKEKGIWEQATGDTKAESEKWRTTRSKLEYGDWEKFPTQPPLCGGDDGLPSELDGITFPEWRKQSIKGYGNAIVPQVAMQIFRAIDIYEKEHE